MMRFNKRYFAWAVLLFITEVLIAAYVHDKFIRPYVGDFLVVILLYCFIKSFFKVPAIPLAILVLLFSYVIELLQYFKLADQLGLGKSSIARIVIGSSFEWIDLIMYTAGIVLVLWVERKTQRPERKKIKIVKS